MRKAMAGIFLAASWAALAFVWLLELELIPLGKVGIVPGYDNAIGGEGLYYVAAAFLYALFAAPLGAAVVAWRARGRRQAKFWAAAAYCAAALVTLLLSVRGGGGGDWMIP